MKYFNISRIQDSVRHLQDFDSNWVVVPLVFAVNGVNLETEVDTNESSRMGGDSFLNQVFSGDLIGLPPFENGVNSLRPRFADFYPNMKSQGKEDDFVYHQPTKLWANVYSSRGYREMRMAGLVSGERSTFKLKSGFAVEWRRRVGQSFKFEELLVWLFGFKPLEENISNWHMLDSEFRRHFVTGGVLEPVYREVFQISKGYPWPDQFTTRKPSAGEYQRALIPSRFERRIELGSQQNLQLQDPSQGPEPIEGLDGGSYGEGGYPINDVLIRQESRTVFEVVRRIRAGRLILDPDFQREFIWSEDKQSKLIESALMRIPLPVFYLAERRDGKAVIVDGLQRLTTFQRYLDNQFTLQGLPDASELNNKSFDDLPPLLQGRIEDTNLILYLIDHKVPERAKLDIFERVNLGIPLTRQQMRNCMYVGPATKWLKMHVKDEAFLDATGRSLDWKTMRDRECVNRFCAFRLLGPDRFKGDLDQFLAETLAQMNHMASDELLRLGECFERSMKNNLTLFGSSAFRKPGQRRNPFNIALFDVLSVVLSDYSESRVRQQTQTLRDQFDRLMNNNGFVQAISSATSDPRRVSTRFSLARASFKLSDE